MLVRFPLWRLEGTVDYGLFQPDGTGRFSLKDSSSQKYVLIKKNNLINLGNVFHNSVILT